jgi:hypothetical protein
MIAILGPRGTTPRLSTCPRGSSREQPRRG